MASQTLNDKYQLWLDHAGQLHDELLSLTEEEIEDAFYRDLAFGTGGLRGVIGAGTNRMNIYTVAKASQGLADYVKRRYPGGSIAVSYDSRNFSELFAQVASGVFAANGIRVYLYPQLMPTPCLSFATRYYQCSAGIMITASHNPAKYNGYKVYNADGCQITTEAAAEILSEIEKLDIFADVSQMAFSAAQESGLIQWISDDCYTAFTEAVKQRSVLYGDPIDRNVTIVYSPLNGTGLKPVTRALQESGFTDIRIVKEQELPDGNFPTCPYPNPEIKEAMALGIEYAKRYQADLLLATDPDCDRVGVAVKDGSDYMLLTGNEMGLLLLDYICSQRRTHDKMPDCPLLVKTIVTTDMASQIAAHYGVETVNVLTGFKFIGEQIGFLEKKGEDGRYIFGFEESYGYLSGSHVRDKDAVNAALLICEMFAYYKTRGICLTDQLRHLYATYGYCLNTLHSYEFEGSAGMTKMAQIMAQLRSGIPALGNKTVESVLDYAKGLDGLPPADVLKFFLSGHCSVTVRPSGTEPKLKVYLSIVADGKDEALQIEQAAIRDLEKFLV